MNTIKIKTRFKESDEIHFMAAGHTFCDKVLAVNVTIVDGKTAISYTPETMPTRRLPERDCHVSREALEKYVLDGVQPEEQESEGELELQDGDRIITLDNVRITADDIKDVKDLEACLNLPLFEEIGNANAVIGQPVTRLIELLCDTLVNHLRLGYLPEYTKETPAAAPAPKTDQTDYRDAVAQETAQGKSDAPEAPTNLGTFPGAVVNSNTDGSKGEATQDGPPPPTEHTLTGKKEEKKTSTRKPSTKQEKDNKIK